MTWSYATNGPKMTMRNNYEVEVESDSRPGRVHVCYPVAYDTRDGWFCPCESFRYSSDAGCKHTERLADEFVPEVKVVGYKRRS